jgi:pyridoxal phosphate enzyme (YggS family)
MRPAATSQTHDADMSNAADSFEQVLKRLRVAQHARMNIASREPVRLLAVSKTRTAADVRALAMLQQDSFGENYVQEALEKQRALADLAPDLRLEWHLIGRLQSNKCRDAALAFDWVQTVDRAKLIPALARHRPASMAPLNVLIQVNIDDEASKSGCTPDAVDALADAVATESRLALHGLMAIPSPDPDMERRRSAFHRMRELFDALRARYPLVDTLSMGMSEDFEVAIAEGATMVRVGTALFGPRLSA